MLAHLLGKVIPPVALFYRNLQMTFSNANSQNFMGTMTQLGRAEMVKYRDAQMEQRGTPEGEDEHGYQLRCITEELIVEHKP